VTDRDAEFAAIIEDPVQFAREMLHHELWETQADILRAVAIPHSQTAVKACHSSSKTFTAAEATLWFLACFDDALVITTAPKFEQVVDELWGEIRKAIRTSDYPFPEPLMTKLVLSDKRYAVGLTAREGVNIQGYHSPHMLIIVDEATGITADIWGGIEGARASGDVRVLALGNPDGNGGPFYEAFTSQRTLWKTFTIDALKTPNLEGLSLETILALKRDLPPTDPIFAYCPVRHLVSRRWVYEALIKYGDQSPYWQGHVRGEFPTQAEDALISLKWLEAARDDFVPKEGDKPKKLMVGIDVAGSDGGDETFVVVRQGGQIVAAGGWTLQDPLGEVNLFLRPFKHRIEEVNIDTIGVGLNFKPRLEALDYPCNGVNVGEATDNPDEYSGLKAQLYWRLRELFQPAGDAACGYIHGLTDELMISQLASIRWKSNLHGKIVIESKDEMKKRGIKSPDRAEALMLAFADRTPGIARYVQELAEQAAARRLDPTLPEPKPDTALRDIYEAERAKLHSGGDNPYDESTESEAPAVERDYSNICQKCRSPINGTATRIGAKAWHVDCFRK